MCPYSSLHPHGATKEEEEEVLDIMADILGPPPKCSNRQRFPLSPPRGMSL